MRVSLFHAFGIEVWHAKHFWCVPRCVEGKLCEFSHVVCLSVSFNQQSPNFTVFSFLSYPRFGTEMLFVFSLSLFGPNVTWPRLSVDVAYCPSWWWMITTVPLLLNIPYKELTASKCDSEELSVRVRFWKCGRIPLPLCFHYTTMFGFDVATAFLYQFPLTRSSIIVTAILRLNVKT